MSLLRQQTQAQTNTKLLGYQAQTSIYGRPIAIVYGRSILTGNVLWFGDWKANPVKQSGGKFGSGKGSGGGKGGSGQQYTYQSAIQIGLCEGPVNGLGDIWKDKIHFVLNQSTETATIPSGGGNFTPVNATNFFSDFGTGAVKAYSVTANDYGSPGSVTLSGTHVVPLKKVAGSPTIGQYSVNPATGVYTFGPSASGLSVQITYSWSDPNASNDGNPTATLQLAFINGARGQTPWSYLTTNHPDQALGYSGLASVASELMDLGSTGVVSNYKFEVIGFLSFGAGIDDANPADVIADFVSNPFYGALFPAANVGNLQRVRNFCTANGIFISPVIDSQKPASSWMDDFALVANSEYVWSDGRLKVKCYGDKTAVGNGVTFTPDTTPIYDLDEEDYLGSQGQEKISVSRPSVKTAYNSVKIQWLNRGNGYQAEPVEEKDDYHIGLYGLRPAPAIQASGITSLDVARKAASYNLQRGLYVRNTYGVKVSAVKYCLLEPMDLVTLTKPELNLAKTPVRLKNLNEDDGLVLDLNFEDFPWGTASPTLNPKQTTGPFGPGYFAQPGNVNEPLFFEAPSQLTQGVLFELLIALSGGNEWGGANVYVSTDGGASYNLIGVQNGPATMGTLTADLPISLDPDDSNTLSIDLTESGGELLSYTEDQEDNFVPLLLVDDELISYRTATLTSPLNYGVTHMRRGVYDSVIALHRSSTPIAFLDGQLFSWVYDESSIGTTLFFKFASFNQAGQQVENLANVAAYPYFVHGPRLPYPAYFGTNGQVPGVTSELWHYFELFALQQYYAVQSDGTYLPQLLVTAAWSPINDFSAITQPPVISAITTPSTGGTVPGGKKLRLGFYAVDSNVNFSDMTVVTIDVPTGTNTNTITGTFALFNTSDTLNIVWSMEGNDGWAAPVTSIASGITGLWTITAIDNLGSSIVAPIRTLAPDPLFDHFKVQASEVLVSGIWTGPITAAAFTSGTTVITVAGTPWTSGALVGRVLSIIGTAQISPTFSRPLPCVNVLITANTANTVSVAVDLTGTSGLTAVNLQAGDIISIRTRPDTFTSRTIGDSALTLIADELKGSLLWIIEGTGANQIVPVSGNTTGGTITTGNKFTTVPDATSVFIVIKNGWQYSLDTINLTTSFLTGSTIPLPIDNTAAKIFLVQLLSVASDGSESLIEFSPYREIYSVGKGGGDANTQMTISIPGPLATGSDLGPVAFFQTARSLNGTTIKVDDAPTGSDAILKVYDDTTSTLLWTVTITAGTKSGTTTGSVSVAAGDRIRIDCTQPGSTNPGGNDTGVAIF